MKINKQILVKRVLPVVIGGLLGYAYYYFIGCYSGTCPISSNPYISTIYGGILGGVFAMPSKKKNKEVKENG
jgi:LytS/YehU family sensor histidine kinase